MFDAAIFLANLLLVAPLTTLVRDTQGYHPLFAVLMFLAVLSHAAGAWLKRRPLQARMMQQPEWTGGAYLLFLTLGVMHLGLFIACMQLALDVLEVPEKPGLWLTFTIGLLPTLFTVRGIMPLRHAVTDDARLLRRKEMAADALLCFSMVMILVWWEGVFVESTAGRGWNWFMSALLVVLMSVPFAMFYLAPRMLYLAEDFREKKTWIRILIVMMPLAWRLVWG